MKTMALIVVLFLAVVVYLEWTAPPTRKAVPFAGAPIPIPSVRLTQEQIDDGWTVVRQGIFDGEFEKLMELLRRKKDDEFIEAVEKDPLMVKYQHGQLGSLLIPACSFGRLKCAQYLIDQGADPNVVSGNGGTALSACIRSVGNSRSPVDHVNLIDLILKSGADATVIGVRRGKWQTEHDVMLASDTYLEFGVKLQRSKAYHFIPRNAVLARLREHLDLPCDAMLPINANSLYLIDDE
jgi:hypothetical protein